jgi:methionine sulfoxide reductase catalytic subunit
MKQIKPSEITPEHVYYSRREFLKTAGAVLAGGVIAAACGGVQSKDNPKEEIDEEIFEISSTSDELGDPLTSYRDITNYNNYYEFSTNKEDVARLSQNLRISPWSVSVGGLVSNPKVYDVDDIKRKFDLQERVYRLRCVEGWSMVIPWLGFPLAELIDEVEPTSEAKYVRFETLYDPEQMPGQKSQWYSWPYIEGLRIDEAMNDLTILAVGLYGKDLLPQNGAPIRLVVPWKYGFKSMDAGGST